MVNHEEIKHERDLHAILLQVIYLLDKQELESEVSLRQATHHPELVKSILERQHVAELQKKISHLHPADLAYILEGLPLFRRKLIWEQISDSERGVVLLELSEAVRDHLLEGMPENEILNATQELETDEIAYLLPSLPDQTAAQLLNRLDRDDRRQVQTMLSCDPGTVGALMEFDTVTVREEVSLEVVLRYLRKLREIPPGVDQLFVIDRHGLLKGALSLKVLLTHDPAARVGDLMVTNPLAFYAQDAAQDAVEVFDRYGLVSAPVVDQHQRLVGVISVDVVVDFLQESADLERLKQAGLTEDEDLFAPIWKSGKNRWAWLLLNLVTAFIASRVIGAFEETIAQVVTLATLMPIVASIGGNTGNQTAALMIRELALKQIHSGNIRYLIKKELGIGFMNGLIWGLFVGLITYLLYFQFPLAAVMAGAMLINLVLASLVGVFIPLILHNLDRDPVHGSSVILTAVTDSMGFFVFLGLASVFI